MQAMPEQLSSVSDDLVFKTWRESTLGTCCEKPEYGVTASASPHAVGPKFLRITDIQDGAVIWSSVPYCDAEAWAHERKFLRKGDIVIARIGATTGKAFLVEECPPAVFASYLIRVRVDPDKLYPQFLYYYLQTPNYWKHIDQYKDDRLKGGVNIPILEAITVPLPSLEEQVLIAQSLSLVQRCLTVEQMAQSATEQLKRAAMRTLFSHGRSGGEQRETEFGWVPQEWGERALDDCATIQTGAAKGRKFADAETVSVPYLRVANVQDGHLDLREMKEISIRKSEIDRYRLQTDDVVLTEGGDFDKLGRGFIWRGEIELCVHQNHVFAVRTDKKKLLPEFFAYLAQSPYGKAYFLKVAHKTTNLACINSAKLKAFPVLIPPSLDEQREIVAILDVIDRKIKLHKRKRALLEELFKALLHKLMTHEISVDDLDLGVLREPAIPEAV